MQYAIFTGKYESGTPEQKQKIINMLGNENTATDFSLYFHWYNIVHELGHLIIHYNQPRKYDNVDEEQLVNDFAVAFWTFYGENDKLERVKNIVSKSLERFERPVPADTSHYDYAKDNWDNESFWTINNYGWFQFSCVSSSFANGKSLSEALKALSGKDVQPQFTKTLEYTADYDMPKKIVEDATKIVRSLGIELPFLPVILVDDPDKQSVGVL